MTVSEEKKMSVSKKQSAANAANAQKSTGPKTTAGKERSSRNALTHGLTTLPGLLPDEDAQAYADFSDAMFEHYSTDGPLEYVILEDVTACLWRLRRYPQAEAGIMTWHQLDHTKRSAKSATNGSHLASPMEITIDRITEKQNDLPCCAQAILADIRGPDALQKLHRYETATLHHMEAQLNRLNEMIRARNGSRDPENTP
jgi:hypothetical protein